MRAYLDANLYISYLLRMDSAAPPAAIVRAGLARQFAVVYSDPTVREVLEKATRKPYLADRISPKMIDTFLRRLGEHGEHLAEMRAPIPAVGRDRKDDYLVAHAGVAHVDYLVSRDKDLLILEQFGDVRIVSPAEFLFLLEMEDR